MNDGVASRQSTANSGPPLGRGSKRPACCLLLIGLALASPARAADQVDVRGGKPLLGKVQRESATEVMIETPGGQEVISVNRVLGIRYEAQGATMTQARILEEAYDLRRAAEQYAKAQSELDGKPLILQAARFGEARVLARLALDESAGLEEAIARLDRLIRQHADSRHYYPARELLGRLYLEKQDYAAAAGELAELAQAPWLEVKWHAAVYQSRLARSQGKPNEAIQRLGELLAAKPNSSEEELVQREGLLELAACHGARGQRDSEISTLEKLLARPEPHDRTVQAEAYIALGDAYRATEQTKRALFAYLHVDLLFASHKELHARALYNLYELWTELGQADRAAAAQATLKTQYPTSPWTKKLGA